MNEKITMPTAAFYLRLSDSEKTGFESGSISSQREILKSYSKNNGLFSVYTFKEYCDDGFGGMNFERPQFKKLLGDVQTGQIKCILVKDLSRFFRNYIEAGRYIEDVFPFLAVRLIAVNDGFDSSLSSCDFLCTAFKNIANELYSRELSEKVIHSRRLHASTGSLLSAYAPYGYIKKDGKLFPDNEAAQTVIRIFRLYSGGLSKTVIAGVLNNENVPSPLMLRRKRNEHFSCGCAKEKCLWSVSAISAILKDRRYTGDLVYGKRVPKAIGSRKSVYTAPNEWITAKNCHEPIVPRSLFEKVNNGS